MPVAGIAYVALESIRYHFDLVIAVPQLDFMYWNDMIFFKKRGNSRSLLEQWFIFNLSDFFFFTSEKLLLRQHDLIFFWFEDKMIKHDWKQSCAWIQHWNGQKDNPQIHIYSVCWWRAYLWFWNGNLNMSQHRDERLSSFNSWHSIYKHASPYSISSSIFLDDLHLQTEFPTTCG